MADAASTLVFAQHGVCTFEGDAAIKVPEQTTVQMLIPLDADARPASLRRNRTYRESYLTSMAARFVCRWRIVAHETASAAQIGDDIVENADAVLVDRDTAQRMFYACLPLEHEKRVGMRKLIVNAPTASTMTAGAVREADANVRIVDAGTRCERGTELHDWSADLTDEKVLNIRQRPHIHVKCSHPCNDGAVHVPVADRTLVTSSASAARRGGASSAEAARPYMAELTARLQKRSVSSEQVVRQIDEHLEQRRQTQAQQQAVQQAADRQCAADTQEAVTRMIDQQRRRVAVGDLNVMQSSRARVRAQKRALTHVVYDSDASGSAGDDDATSSSSSNHDTDYGDDEYMYKDETEDESSSSATFSSDESESCHSMPPLEPDDAVPPPPPPPPPATNHMPLVDLDDVDTLPFPDAPIDAPAPSGADNVTDEAVAAAEAHNDARPCVMA